MKSKFNLVAGCVILTSVLLIIGCRITPEPRITQRDHNPWVTGKEKVVGIVKLSSDKDLKLPADFLQQVETDLISYLPTQGYRSVVAAEHYVQIQQQVIPENIQFYDAITGKFNHALKQQLDSTVIAQYQQQYQADVLLSLHFAKAVAEYSGDKARWDGMEDKTALPPNFLLDSRKGTMPAISVHIEVQNLLTGERYSRVQGVQAILNWNASYHMHSDDVPMHLQNLRIGIRQMTY
jgi:hypothetical protein